MDEVGALSAIGSSTGTVIGTGVRALRRGSVSTVRGGGSTLMRLRRSHRAPHVPDAAELSRARKRISRSTRAAVERGAAEVERGAEALPPRAQPVVAGVVESLPGHRKRTVARRLRRVGRPRNLLLIALLAGLGGGAWVLTRNRRHEGSPAASEPPHAEAYSVQRAEFTDRHAEEHLPGEEPVSPEPGLPADHDEQR